MTPEQLEQTVHYAMTLADHFASCEMMLHANSSDEDYDGQLAAVEQASRDAARRALADHIAQIIQAKPDALDAARYRYLRTQLAKSASDRHHPLERRYQLSFVVCGLQAPTPAEELDFYCDVKRARPAPGSES